jgi:hypothetical protein
MPVRPPVELMPVDELPFHRWPKSYGGWQAGSIIRCEGADCQWCKARWTLVDPRTLEDGFRCPRCGAVSHNPNDAREQYCGRCHVFVTD